eukprot:TRINITY_DN67440_c0_g1_i1.p1 TRINITY_DN67440_c0_g1~~TRINITY_DN67440_c0_g1_i1.p1  ORF type:complete len:825 (+),score=138.78 TRINITY_DN67440_c0_g1_i1:147-2621(+)
MADLDLDINICGLGPLTAAPARKQSHGATSKDVSHSSAEGISSSSRKTKGKGRRAGKVQSHDNSEFASMIASNDETRATPKNDKIAVAASTTSRKLKKRKRPANDQTGVTKGSSAVLVEAPAVVKRRGKKRRLGSLTPASEPSATAADRTGKKTSGRMLASSEAEVQPKPKKRPKTDGTTEKHNVSNGCSFDALGLHENLLRQLTYLKFTRCTPIQTLAVPVAIGKVQKDVMLRAPTGSGKTLAFLLPVIHQILMRGCRREDGTLAVVLSPTKELALQTLKVAQDVTRMSPSIVCGSIAGGEKPKSEKARLRKGLTLVCATPGRLTYHLEHTATFKKEGLRHLVLDEADRLLDMGFEPQVRSIYKQMRLGGSVAGPSDSFQTLLVSATLTPAVRRLGEFCLRKGACWVDPSDCDAGGALSGPPPEDATDATTFEVPDSLTQWYCEVPCRERLPALVAAILSRARGSGTTGRKAQKSIVFFSCCASVDFHHDLFLEAPWPSRTGGSKRNQTPARKLKNIDGFVGYSEDIDGNDEEEDDDADEEEDAEKKQTDAKTGKAETPKLFSETRIFKLHGNLTKDERAGYVADFARSPGGALLASDAASRGLDFPQIDWIIQYDPPQRSEEYLHRVGRTARIGRAGNALIFLQPSEMGFLDILKEKGLNNLKRLEVNHLHRALLSSGAPRELATAQDIPSLMLAALKRSVEDNQALVNMARKAFLSSLKSYRAFPRELRSVFDSQQLHVGHFAGSFALRETPKEAVRKEREFHKSNSEDGSGRGWGSGAEKGRGRGSSGRGGGRGGFEASSGDALRRPKRQLPRVADEFEA